MLQYLDNALPDEEFKIVQECLIDHPMRHSNVNSEEAFGGTRGFVVSFNEAGIKDLENHKLFSCLSPYFQRHRLPNCNAWILNMVWAEVPAYDKEFAISRHVRTFSLACLQFQTHTCAFPICVATLKTDKFLPSLSVPPYCLLFQLAPYAFLNSRSLISIPFFPQD